MSEYVSSWGKTALEICVAARDFMIPGAIAIRLTIRSFQDLCDRYGHAVKLELPGTVCSFLRDRKGCLYAEVMHTPNRADACVIAVFENSEMLESSITSLISQDFVLAPHLSLRCPPFDVLRGDLENVV